jgi:hypothetical protein
MTKTIRDFASAVTPLAVIGALALSFTTARADNVTAPAVPGDLQVEKGVHPFLEGHGIGTQNYICLPAGTGVAWTLFTPEATLFKDDVTQLITHFASPNPDEKGTVRVSWQHSRDTSAVWATLVKASTDAAFVAHDAIPWLLLKVSGRRTGPDGGDALTSATFIQRVNTVGGLAPATGCAGVEDVGAKAFVPYEADYYFFTGP